jgi:hypothetical protein
MKVDIEKWSISELLKKVDLIDYPEFQREPTVWNLEKKQRLIDSILRGFNISLLYFFKNAKDRYDCIDGRQRINAILSYLDANADYDEADNGFHLKIENEIYDDANKFADIDSKRWRSIKNNKRFTDRVKTILNYKLHIAIISDIEQDEELNLLFLRLQIASILNAGEKLHAMTGDMRDWIFIELYENSFFNRIKIPRRRYAREQVAAQVAINAFSKKNTQMFHRSRYIDLQDFFKQYSKMSSYDMVIKNEIEKKLIIINKNFNNKLRYIKNRATAVTIYLFVSELIDSKREREITTFIQFFIMFIKTLKWQIPKGVKMDSEYHDLLNFQTNVSQAAGEKSAIQTRHDFLKRYFHHFKQYQEIKGDRKYIARTKKKPADIRKKIVL